MLCTWSKWSSQWIYYDQIAEDKSVRDTLNRNPPINIPNSACKTGKTHGCTNLNGIPGPVIGNLKRLKMACDSENNNACFVAITGGTEGGHSDHGPGKSAVDISNTSSIRTYFGTINAEASSPKSGTKVNLPGGGVATFENTGDNGKASAPHWHIQY
jgi:hypothetical protein